MNPKTEFVKAIMSVLRLEANIYTNGAIETIIERLEVSDYQLFIAYLGERKADYEKPIENIAKGVEEFYDKKIEPFRNKALEMATDIKKALTSVSQMMENDEYEISEEKRKKIKVDIEKLYGEQGESFVDYQIKSRIKNEHRKLGEDEYKNFIETSTIDNDFFKTLRYKDENNTRVFTDEMLNVIFEIGIEKLANEDFTRVGTFCSGFVCDYYMKDMLKPSIKEKISITANDNLVQLSNPLQNLRIKR